MLNLRHILYTLFAIMAFCSTSQVTVHRGPYLQVPTQSSVIVRWSTDIPTSTKLTFGFESSFHFGVRFNSDQTTDHEVKISGLIPNTVYSYSIGSMDSMLMISENLFFRTLPEKGSVGPYSFMVIGDAGQGTQPQRDVSLAFQEAYGVHHDGVILLGDNAYWSGTDSEYQNKFFDGFYNEIFENTVIWPAPGNHDYYSASVPMTPTAPYFDIFNIPTSGECGGVPSNTPQYYSFDYGNIHFISLDSYGVSRLDTADMADWLRMDLANNDQDWTIAYWHHPPYSKGSHDSDNLGGSDHELPEMRENIVPILENYGVDLVLSGHSHSYERSKLIGGHYGPSSTFSSVFLKSRFSGNEDIDCAYYKYTDSSSNINQGAVYAVVGTSGWTSPVKPDWPHPVMYSYTNQRHGALRILVQDKELSAEFLTAEGDVFDKYKIKKDVYFVELGFPCDDPNENSWAISPNPVLDELYIHQYGFIASAGDELDIFDLNGRLISRSGLQEENRFDLRHFEAGIYMVIIRENGNVHRLKFLKN